MQNTIHLHDIQDSKIDKATLLCVVDICAFDNNGMSRKIHTPSKCCSTAQNFNKSLNTIEESFSKDDVTH